MNKSKEQEQLYSDLNLFNALLSICESSIFCSKLSREYETQISMICRKAMAEIVDEYDLNNKENKA